MRLALVAREYPPETAKGGIGSQTFAKAHGLAQLGHEVHVISQSPDGSRWEYLDREVRVTRITADVRPLLLNSTAADWLVYSSAVAREIAALHTSTPLDLVDFPEYGGEGYVHFLNRCEWNYLPSVVQIHGPVVMFAETMGWPEFDSELYRLATEMERTCLRSADGVYASSANSRDWCARAYGLDASRILTMHTGVDTSVFRPHGAAESRRPMVAFAGRITRNKGVSVLVEAMCQIHGEYPDLILRLIGRAEESFLDELRQIARKFDADSLLEFCGQVDRHELPRYLCPAHIFASPSLSEAGPGLVNLEAMACGLPVIASQGTGAAEAVCDGDTGLLVPPGDARSLAAAIRHLLVNPKLRRSMGDRGVEYVRVHADSSHCLRQLEEFYKSVIAARSELQLSDLDSSYPRFTNRALPELRRTLGSGHP